MSREDPAPYAYEGLDRVLHEKARLGILTALAANEGTVPFVELKRLCRLTDGNLARHLATLEEAGLVRVKKVRRDGRSLSQVRLSASGRRQFVRYLEELERVIRDAREHTGREAGPGRAGLAPS